MKIDLNMSDPLTLGLNLGIGHSVTQRIRRLTMRQTNKYMLGGTVMIIAAGLGISSAAFSTDSNKPLKEAVKTVLEKVETPTSPKFDATPKSLPDPEKKNVPPKAFRKLAEAPSLKPPKQSRSATGLKPMRLRFNPRFTTEQLEKIQKQRKAYVTSDDDKILKMAMDDTFFKASFKNRFELTIDDLGIGRLKISLGQGAWPGYPATNTGWLKRDMSADMERGLKDVIKRCSSALAPVYFNSDITEGDADIGKGTFEVECVPGTAQILKNTSELDLAYAYLNSDDLPLQTRQNNFQWKIGFAMMNEYVKNNPRATLADDITACIRMNTERKNKHAFNERHRKQADHFLSQCPDANYNWVRKREKMPEVQQ